MVSIAEALYQKLKQLQALNAESKILSAQKKEVKDVIDELLQRADNGDINAQLNEAEIGAMAIQVELFSD